MSLINAEDLVHGYWIMRTETDKHGNKRWVFTCSHCGITHERPFWNCPNCGARMDAVATS